MRFPALIVTCLLAAASATAQTPGPKPLLAEDVFKNVQLLKGIPVKEFMNTMGFFSAATNLNCIDCHSPQSEDLAGYAIDTPLKQTTRKMITMVNTLNKANFGGQRKVTCYTCHRATDHPEAIPSLQDQYSVPEDDPDRAEVIQGPKAAQSANKISPDQVLDKYFQAIGGTAGLAKLTSFVAKGTYAGFETLSEKVPLEIFANAPNQLSTVIHTRNGDSVTDARTITFRRRPGRREARRYSFLSRRA
jgi:hypothetical protein